MSSSVEVSMFVVSEVLESLTKDPELLSEKLKIPIDIVDIILFLDIDLFFELFDDSSISGICGRRKDKTFFIKINKNEPEYRQRFTMAHELGHYILHLKDKPGNGEYNIVDSEDIMYRKPMLDSSEREANDFAAKLLMPRKAIVKNLKSILNNLGESFDLIREVINPLATIFNVSPSAIKVRLIKLGILNNN